ncbi:uncharacterized protein N7484_002196 [Penicillium longicatenatum]|uniref:uncharacterized protein n=1 Tax=Penicillium longicatenatum TaxID=1561947 RepID=UPI00254928DB|nr:uncharacterized protein N7484_002196 [Penicillium longicatenatum]KAJ5658547.1 hypothetical protein N7484_002196 [Penicillium longicatenatum]
MGGMNLRTKIRAPTRYGECSEESPTAALLQSMRRSRAEATDEIRKTSSPDGSHSLRREVKVEFQRKPLVEFDPSLPPAAFPTLDMTKPTVPPRSIVSICQYTDRKPFFLERPTGPELKNDDDNVDQATLNDIENHVASNNELNPVYQKNMAIIAGQVHDNSDEDDSLYSEDSDRNEPKDASVVLGEKIADPTWADIVPPMQVEIIENMFRGGMSWKHICTKLEIPREGRNKFKAFLRTRNQQIRRENAHLTKMRENQLRALMRIDNSDIKTNDVPHQLVLRRFFSEAAHENMADRIPDFMLCQAADVLAGRQYLARKSLPRSLTGDWDHSLVVLRKPGEDASLEPERFEWKQDLNLAPELTDEVKVIGSGDHPIIRTKRGYIQCIAGKGTAYIRDLGLKPGEEQPIVDWRKYFPFGNPVPDAQVPEVEIVGPSDGLIRLTISPGRAAQIDWDGRNISQEDPMIYSGSSPGTPQRQLCTPNPAWSPDVAPDDTPIKRTINPKMLAAQLAALPGRPLETLQVGKEIHRALSLIHPKQSRIHKRTYSPPKQGIFSVRRAHEFKRRESMPLKRSMGGCWSMSSIHYVNPAIGQNRYSQQIQEAKYEAQILKFQTDFTHDVDTERTHRKVQEERVEPALSSPIRGAVSDDMFSKLFDQRVPPSDETLMGDIDLGSSFDSPESVKMNDDDVMNGFMVREDEFDMNELKGMNGNDDSMETIDAPMEDEDEDEDEMVMVEG